MSVLQCSGPCVWTIWCVHSLSDCKHRKVPQCSCEMRLTPWHHTMFGISFLTVLLVSEHSSDVVFLLGLDCDTTRSFKEFCLLDIVIIFFSFNARSCFFSPNRKKICAEIGATIIISLKELLSLFFFKIF